ncbi:MAG: hypothetical protein KVP17_002612 [Porospora cf. gigantea B]|uniref:uncharacterized protein n=1 Tax=Porospora cf. gigantea B TaxID=2853592 RepID=UPI003571D713|nr:MAG: hypothetical protein KVP17_002612 [Porospora cf. gigantea B]
MPASSIASVSRFATVLNEQEDPTVTDIARPVRRCVLEVKLLLDRFYSDAGRYGHIISGLERLFSHWEMDVVLPLSGAPTAETPLFRLGPFLYLPRQRVDFELAGFQQMWEDVLAAASASEASPESWQDICWERLAFADMCEDDLTAKVWRLLTREMSVTPAEAVRTDLFREVNCLIVFSAFADAPWNVSSVDSAGADAFYAWFSRTMGSPATRIPVPVCFFEDGYVRDPLHSNIDCDS